MVDLQVLTALAAVGHETAPRALEVGDNGLAQHREVVGADFDIARLGFGEGENWVFIKFLRLKFILNLYRSVLCFSRGSSV